MIDAAVHRIVIVDEERRPVGIASARDLVEALAHSES